VDFNLLRILHFYKHFTFLKIFYISTNVLHFYKYVTFLQIFYISTNILHFYKYFTFLQIFYISTNTTLKFIYNNCIFFLHFVDVSVCPAGTSRLFCCVNCEEIRWGQQESRNVCAVVQNYTASYARRQVHSCYNDNLKFHGLITSCFTRGLSVCSSGNSSVHAIGLVLTKFGIEVFTKENEDFNTLLSNWCTQR
jgi:hypothetical protein